MFIRTDLLLKDKPMEFKLDYETLELKCLHEEFNKWVEEEEIEVRFDLDQEDNSIDIIFAKPDQEALWKLTWL